MAMPSSVETMNILNGKRVFANRVKVPDFKIGKLTLLSMWTFKKRPFK